MDKSIQKTKTFRFKKVDSAGKSNLSDLIINTSTPSNQYANNAVSDPQKPPCNAVKNFSRTGMHY